MDKHLYINSRVRSTLETMAHFREAQGWLAVALVVVLVVGCELPPAEEERQRRSTEVMKEEPILSF